MFFNYFDAYHDYVRVVCNSITYRHSLMGYRAFQEGFLFGWLLSTLEETKGEDFRNWCRQHDEIPPTKDKIEWLQAHLNEEQRAKFDAFVQTLQKDEQNYKEELEQELKLNYEDADEEKTERVARRYVKIGIVALITFALFMLCNHFTIGEI